MGLQACVECPFKLFKAQSGVFFSSDLKMGIRGHSFFFPGSPFTPFFFPFNTDNLTNFPCWSLSLMSPGLLSPLHIVMSARNKAVACICVHTGLLTPCLHPQHTHVRSDIDLASLFSPAVSSIVCQDIVHSSSVFPCIWIPFDLLTGCKDVLHYCSMCRLLWFGSNNRWHKGLATCGRAKGDKGRISFFFSSRNKLQILLCWKCHWLKLLNFTSRVSLLLLHMLHRNNVLQAGMFIHARFWFRCIYVCLSVCREKQTAAFVRVSACAVCLLVHRWGLVVRASLDWPINYDGLLMICNGMIY